MDIKKQNQIQLIREMAKTHQVEILAHIYQRAEIRAAADFVGGSEQIIKEAINSQSLHVLVCGAVFITDEIRTRRPNLNLIIPRGDLSCPLASAVTLNEALKAKKNHPDALLVVDLKATPDIKALADLTISAQTAHEKLAQTKGQKLIMLPGPYWADWAGVGHQVINRWPKAVCQVHQLALPCELKAAKKLHPKAQVAVNVLCQPELYKMAHFVGDAAAITNFCRQSPENEFVIVSEVGLAEYLTELLPHKVFHETEAELFCPNMKLTNLKSIIRSLESLSSFNA
ncbi:MAG: quinolinate synthase NadA [Candidatus Adiutrix sp.]